HVIPGVLYNVRIAREAGQGAVADDIVAGGVAAGGIAGNGGGERGVAYGHDTAGAAIVAERVIAERGDIGKSSDRIGFDRRGILEGIDVLSFVSGVCGACLQRKHGSGGNENTLNHEPGPVVILLV